MSRLTQQLTRSAFKQDLEEFVFDKYDFILNINNYFDLSVENYPSLKKYINKPIINLLSLEKNTKDIDKDIYTVLLNACIKNHQNGIQALASVYHSAVGRKIAIKVYKNFFETTQFIDFILGGSDIEEEFNLEINLTPNKALALLRLLIASANK